MEPEARALGAGGMVWEGKGMAYRGYVELLLRHFGGRVGGPTPLPVLPPNVLRWSRTSSQKQSLGL